MAVKPWLGAMKAPSDYKAPKGPCSEPKASLSLEYVYGYRAKDMKNNCRLLKNGKIVYNAAALGIVMDIEKNTQKFFDDHGDDVTSIAVHPDGVLVATGELQPKGSLPKI